MNSEIKTKWIEALRNGEYKQGMNVLRSKDNCFCCLGVLCDLYAKENDVDWVFDKFHNDYEINGQHRILPVEILNWSGMKTRLGQMVNNPEYISLTNLNDNLEFTFDQIADVIEEYL